MLTINEKIKVIKHCTNIIGPFLNNLNYYSEKNALWVANKYYTYQQLYTDAQQLLKLLTDFSDQRCAIFSFRHYTAYVGMLSSLLAGKAYVPLNPKMPLANNKNMFDLANTRLLIIDRMAEAEAINFLKTYTKCLDVILYDYETMPAWTSELAIHHYYTKHEVLACADLLVPISSTAITDDACLLFTSGTTGIPKGVMLSHKNILTYLAHTVERYQLTEHDRVSQVTELTFDFSIQDIFIAWAVGACVYAFPENYFMGFPHYIQQHQITFMTTVPSTARLLHQFDKLRPGIFPSLRQNIFGGEPLSDSLAAIWQQAAPNTKIDNVCGPTEATIAFTAYQWNTPATLPNRECVPIGRPFPGQEILIIDSNLKPVAAGKRGELCLAGDQVIKCYWNNELLTAQRFIVLPDKAGKLKRWYRTGDLVIWDEQDGVIFKGRIDDQVKIRGYRVEKLEVEKVIREIAETEFVAVIPWPISSDGVVHGLVAYACHAKKSSGLILKECRHHLPDYMLPKEIINCNDLPLNINGKVDYLKIMELHANKCFANERIRS